MNRSPLERLAPLTGIAFIVLLIVATIVGGEPPDADEATEEAVSFWTDNDSENVIAAVLTALSALFLVWFGASVRTALRRAEGEPGRVAAISFAGYVIAAVGTGLFAGIQFSAAETAGDVPPEVTQTLSVLNADLFFPLAVGVYVAFAANAVLILRHGGLPRWLGWAAIAIVIVSLTPAGFIGFIAAALWILVVSVLLYQAEAGAAAPRPPGGETAL